jgi:hypothetical protein
MGAAREYRGLWWLPSDESQKRSGTLAVIKGDAVLDLLSHFGHRLLSETKTQKTYSLDLAEPPRIVGLSTGGNLITLERPRVASHTDSFPGIPTATYTPGVTLIGKQFADDERIGFDEIAIRASDLNSWTEISGFAAKFGMEKHADKGYDVFSNVEIRFEAPDDIEIALARGDRAFIRFSAPSEGIGSGTDHVALTQEAALHLRFSKRASLEQIFDRVGQIRNFLSLAVGRPVAILSVIGYQDDYVRGNTATLIPIELLWGIPHNPNPPTPARRPSQMLFTLSEANPTISSVTRIWFAKQARLQPVFNLFFGARYHPDMYLEVKFLSYAQAVETYDYRRRRKPEKKTLAQGMTAVLDECRTVSKRIVGTEPADKATFIEAFKTSRNYYTHYDPKLEKKAARGAALLLLTIQLQAIIEMSLLRELGFDCRSIGNILQRARRYEEIERLAIIAKTEAENS